MSRIIGVIPARLESTRLPRKLLLNETGKTLIQHTWENAIKCKALDDVIIATDSLQILGECQKFGAHFEMTSPDHPNGTSRIAELVEKNILDQDIIVNIQGDEPEIDPIEIDWMCEVFEENKSIHMATMATSFETEAEWNSLDSVKVVCDSNWRALFFCRQPVIMAERHIGIYAYRIMTLIELQKIKPTTLERVYRLEQMRALEMGLHIHVHGIKHAERGIDTRKDYAQFVERWKKQNVVQEREELSDLDREYRDIVQG